MKYSFKDDYSEGCHPAILQKLIETNHIQTVEGNYGNDQFSVEARCRIHEHLQNPEAEFHFVSGGTQANLIVISSFLKPYEAVISAHTGHIEVHETGAIEATGHKVIPVSTGNGKLNPEQIQEVLDFHKDEHQVLPRMVYISNATETGTVYTRKELTALSEFCRSRNLLLFMDGARLATALTSHKNDLTLAEISRLTDVFYIGGTKNGALLGEAIVINKTELQPHFRFAIKQKGALLAKSRILGIQFLALFDNDLFFSNGTFANAQAQKLTAGLSERGFEFLNSTESNQIFPVFSKNLIQHLQQYFSFHVWQNHDDRHDVVRLVTSWATEDEQIDRFLTSIDDC